MHYIDKIYTWSLIMLLPLAFLNEFSAYIPVPAVRETTLLFLGFFIFSSLLLGSGTPRLISLCSITVGLSLAAYYGIPAGIWLSAFSKNLPIVVLLLCVPMLTIPLRIGGFLGDVSSMINYYMTKPQKLRLILTSIVFGLSSIANLSAIRIIHPFLSNYKFSTRYYATLYTGGFTPCLTWSPYYMSVSVVLYYTNQPFYSYLPYGLFYSICLTLLGLLLYNFFYPENVPNGSNSVAKPVVPIKSIAGILGLFVSVLTVDKLMKFSNPLLLVSFVSVLYTLAWCALQNKRDAFRQELSIYMKAAIVNKNELVLFLSVGFLGVIMAQTPIKLVIKYIVSVISSYPTFLIIIFIHLTIIILSSLCIHQIISIIALALSVTPQDLGLSQIQFCLTLIGSYTLSTILSPFVPYNLMLSNLLNTSSVDITYRANGIFGICAILLSGIIISFVFG